MSDPQVDLLLVRLGGDEEKKKVTRLLVTELDMTVLEAERAVENSPVVLRESVPIGEARIIQKNLYPYIDLLPRLEDEQVSTLKQKVQFVTSPVDDFAVDEDAPEAGGTSVDDEEYFGGEAGVKPAQAEEDDVDDDDDEGTGGFRLTTASDEMLAIERCHICGKTPVGGERLAPCRACGDLTCRECFDRTAHVCHKCAADGHIVDRPVASKSPGSRKGSSAVKEPAETTHSPRDTTGLRKALLAVMICAVLALLYFVDPLDLFKTEPENVPLTGTAPDTSIVAPPDTADSQTTSESPDTLATLETTPVSDPLGILALSLPDSLMTGASSQVTEAYTSVPPGSGAESATDELNALLPQLKALAGNTGILLDRAALLIYGDRTKTDHLSVLVLAVNHPENNETRFAFMASVAGWLVPGGIDQMVLCYRETRFHDPQLFSYTSLHFPELSGAFTPAEFRDLAGTHDTVWGSISGPVKDWICGM
ncbi:MAG: hypothetical protein R6V62_05740 [Candidatus Fermentibacteraceae bacterium]